MATAAGQLRADMNGESRTYEPREEGGATLAGQSKRVGINVEEILATLAPELARAWDLDATVETANAHAHADLVVHDVTLATGVPTTALIHLQKRLEELLKLVDAAPILELSEDWKPDPQAPGIYVTEPVKSTRMREEPNARVIVPATDKHPAQVERFVLHVPEGDWTVIKRSGALSVARKRQLTRRLRDLIAATKLAREGANSIDVNQVTLGERILEWIFAA